MNARTIGFLLFVAMIIRGVNFHVAAVALEYLNPISVNTLRFLIGFMPLLMFRLFSKQKAKLNMETKLKLIVFGVFAVFLPNFLFLKGVKNGSILTGSILVALSPVTTVLLSMLILKSRLKNGQWLALVLGCLGAIVTLVAGNTGSGNHSISGNIWFVIFHFVMATNPVLVKKFFSNVDTLRLTLISTATTFVASFLFSGSSLTSSQHLLNPEMWSALCYMGLITTSVMFLIWNKGIQIIGPEKTALFLNLVPVFAFISGLFIGKTWNYGQVGGGMVVIAAVLLNFYFIKKGENRTSPTAD